MSLYDRTCGIKVGTVWRYLGLNYTAKSIVSNRYSRKLTHYTHFQSKTIYE